MDPLSCLSLAGTLVQFVTFASDIVSKSSEIGASASGATADVSNLDSIYTKLLSISSELSLTSNMQNLAPVHKGLKDSVETLRGLAEICKSDCSQLVQVIQQLKAPNGPPCRHKSLRTALKTIWNKHKVADLEEKLSRSQRTLTLQICNVLSLYHTFHSDSLTELKQLSVQHALMQSESLEKIEKALQSINSSINRAKAQPSEHSFSYNEINFLEAEMKALSLTETKTRQQQIICKSLEFQSQPARLQSIPEAHYQTFDWLFGGGDSPNLNWQDHQHVRREQIFEIDAEEFAEVRSQGQKFINWLENGDDIFWVSGKPGAGKSTFMKYVASHQRTSEALCRWAQPLPVIKATHYFWSPGTLMQKSQEGLLQTILLQIYQQMPNLIEPTCGQKWSLPAMDWEWTLQDLKDTLHQIAIRPTLNHKFCFFIDGLDEYQGDHIDLCEIILRLSKSSNVKLCIASRPWNVFEGYFGKKASSKLYIHELTRGDIRNFAYSRISEHFMWGTLESESSQLRASDLAMEITTRAQGVFLWVFLVIRMLRQGLTNSDSIHDLRRRLDTFPVELGPFFKQMLDSVEPTYHEQMAGALSIALGSTTPQIPLIYHFHDLEYASPDYVFKLPVKSLGEDENQQIRQTCSRRLAARCKGLLEVTNDTVEFLHRTAADFLRTREMSDYLLAKQKPGFCLELSLLAATVGCMKQSSYGFVDSGFYGGQGPLIDLLDRVFASVKCIENLDPPPIDFLHNILDEIEKSIILMTTTGQLAVSTRRGADGRSTIRTIFRENILKVQLNQYLQKSLLRDPDYFESLDKPAMMLLLDPDLCRGLSGSEENCPLHHLPVLRCLLECGQNPNHAVVLSGRCETPWIKLITKFVLILDNFSYVSFINREALLSGILQLFLSHGSDVNALVPAKYCGDSSIHSTAWIDLAFVSFYLKSREEIVAHREVMEFVFANKPTLLPWHLWHVGSGSSSEIKPLQSSTVHKEFFKLMTEHVNPQTADSAHLDHLVYLTEHIISIGDHVPVQMDEYWPVIKRTFQDFRPEFEPMLRATYSETRRKRTTDIIDLTDKAKHDQCMKRPRLNNAATEDRLSFSRRIKIDRSTGSKKKQRSSVG